MTGTPSPVAGYSIGTWTPAITFATPGNLSVAYTAQQGQYVRVGNLIFAFFRIVTSTFTHTTASGNLQLTGLPVTSRTLVGEVANSSGLAFQGITKAGYTEFSAQVGSNSALAIFTASGSGSSGTSVQNTDMPTGGTVAISGTLIYLAA